MSKTKKDKAQPDWLTVHVPLKKVLIERLDREATRQNRSRVNMVATLVELALTAKEGVGA